LADILRIPEASLAQDAYESVRSPAAPPRRGHDAGSLENLLSIDEEASIEELIKEFEKR
jgi:hypothetical protein